VYNAHSRITKTHITQVEGSALPVAANSTVYTLLFTCLFHTKIYYNINIIYYIKKKKKALTIGRNIERERERTTALAKHSG